LAEFSFDIEYRPGPNNIVADALSRASAVVTIGDQNSLTLVKQIHYNMGHPGINHTVKYIKSNFDVSGNINKIETEIINKCSVCASEKLF